jgi:hypothetical protein
MLKNEANAQDTKDNKIKEFNPLIIHNRNGYCVYLPEWRISGTGNSLDEAYRKFEQNFKAIEEHAEMFGLATLTPEPYWTSCHTERLGAPFASARQLHG